MPEYLAPGVYIEERSFRSKSIEGVSTSTTGFVGATRYGPTSGEPELITSYPQFERIYGGLDPLDYEDTTVQNYLAHSVRAVFDNGGARLYVARAYEAPNGGDGLARVAIPAPAPAIDQASELAVSVTNTVQSALAAAISEDADAIEDIYEPYLIQVGFIDRTPRGRMATRKAFEHFKISLPSNQKNLF